MILAENLVKRFGKNLAVDDLSLEIRRGETFGLLGPNGAGKTTTISMLIGLLKPDSGTIEIGDANSPRVGNPLSPLVRRGIGIAPQSLSLYGELTGRENLDFFGSLYGLAGRDLISRRDWSLEFAGLSDRQKDRVDTYSGGMKRRLNIAAAMMHEPSVLLLDEPTVGVDPQSRNHIFESIGGLRSGGLTIIYTTHHMEEAQRLCDRVAIIDHGKLLAIDTVDRLIEVHGGDSVVHAELQQPLDTRLLPRDFQVDQLEGCTLRFSSPNPLERVAQLSGLGVQFQTLKVSRPDLESVFLKLTGRSLRD